MTLVQKYANYIAVLVSSDANLVFPIPPVTGPSYALSDHTDGWQAFARGYDEIGMTVEPYGLSFPDPGPWAGLPAYADVEVWVGLVWNNLPFTSSEQGDPIIIDALQDQFTYTWVRHASDTVLNPSFNEADVFHAFELEREVRTFGGTIPIAVENYNGRNITPYFFQIRARVLYQEAVGDILTASTLATGTVSSGVASRGRP